MIKKRRILFRISGCSYCKRAEEALDQAGLEYEKHDVEDRSVVQLLSGQPSVPVLVEVIGCKDQDDDIVKYIKELENSKNDN